MHIERTHHEFMHRCIELAVLAAKAGNTPVGSLVILNGEIIGEAGETLPAGMSLSGHAELLACQNAILQVGRKDLRNAILYTTAEPCFMCSYVIRDLRIAQVVYGLETPLIGGITSCHPILIDPQLNSWRPAPSINGGFMAEECVRARQRTT